MTDHYEFELAYSRSDDEDAERYHWTIAEVDMDNPDGFNIEQLMLLMTNQCQLTLQGVESVDSVKQTTLQEFTP